MRNKTDLAEFLLNVEQILQLNSNKTKQNSEFLLQETLKRYSIDEIQNQMDVYIQELEEVKANINEILKKDLENLATGELLSVLDVKKLNNLMQGFVTLEDSKNTTSRESLLKIKDQLEEAKNSLDSEFSFVSDLKDKLNTIEPKLNSTKADIIQKKNNLLEKNRQERLEGLQGQYDELPEEYKILSNADAKQLSAYFELLQNTSLSVSEARDVQNTLVRYMQNNKDENKKTQLLDLMIEKIPAQSSILHKHYIFEKLIQNKNLPMNEVMKKRDEVITKQIGVLQNSNTISNDKNNLLPLIKAGLDDDFNKVTNPPQESEVKDALRYAASVGSGSMINNFMKNTNTKDITFQSINDKEFKQELQGIANEYGHAKELNTVIKDMSIRVGRPRSVSRARDRSEMQRENTETNLNEGQKIQKLEHGGTEKLGENRQQRATSVKPVEARKRSTSRRQIIDAANLPKEGGWAQKVSDKNLQNKKDTSQTRSEKFKKYKIKTNSAIKKLAQGKAGKHALQILQQNPGESPGRGGI